MTLSQHIRQLAAHATPGPYMIYGEPDVGLP